MSQTVGDYLLIRFSTWGVERVHGYPGDGINGLMVHLSAPTMALLPSCSGPP